MIQNRSEQNELFLEPFSDIILLEGLKFRFIGPYAQTVLDLV